MNFQRLAHTEPWPNGPKVAKFGHSTHRSTSLACDTRRATLMSCRAYRGIKARSLFLSKMYSRSLSLVWHPINITNEAPKGRIEQPVRRTISPLRATPSALTDVKLAVSVIIPVFNEVDSIGVLVERVGSVMRKRGGLYEIICVDDGSTDGSTQLLKAMAAQRDDLRAVIFRRNFGQSAAMAAGFDFALGEILVTLDGDLQNDADDIPTLLEHLLHGNVVRDLAVDTGSTRDDGGYDLVCGWRRYRNDDALTRNFPSRVANWLVGIITGVKLHDHGCSLKVYRASLVKNFRLYGEMHRFIPALAAIEGAAISELQVRHHARTCGRSKYGLDRIPRVLSDLVTLFYWTRFRDRPMQLVGFIGALCLLGSFLAGVYTCSVLMSAASVSGWRMAISIVTPSLFLALDLLLRGVQFLLLGLLFEVCMRTYFETQHHPVYRVREVAPSST